MNEVMVTMKFKESEIDVLYRSLICISSNAICSAPLDDIEKEISELKDALKKLKERIHNEKEKAKQEHQEG